LRFCSGSALVALMNWWQQCSKMPVISHRRAGRLAQWRGAASRLGLSRWQHTATATARQYASTKPYLALTQRELSAQSQSGRGAGGGASRCSEQLRASRCSLLASGFCLAGRQHFWACGAGPQKSTQQQQALTSSLALIVH
jgi:hypothetical protein